MLRVVPVRDPRAPLKSAGVPPSRSRVAGFRVRVPRIREATRESRRAVTVRQSFVRGRFETPKSRSSRRTIELGPRALEALREQWAESVYRAEESVVFGHPKIGSPLDPSRLTKNYLRPALKRAGIVKPFRPWHDLRHTALTHEAAAGNPAVYVQLKAGHSQGSITERYVHAAQVLFPGAAAKGEARTFSGVVVESR